MSERYVRNTNVGCAVCGVMIYRRPAQIKLGRVCCGQDCYGKSQRKERACVVCGTPMLAGLNKKTCCRACANSNRKGIRYGRGSPKDKVKAQRSLKIRLLKQRGPQCERCGYQKVPILQVHHKDRDRQNNELSNLELICANCHAEEHYLENSWWSGRMQ